MERISPRFWIILIIGIAVVTGFGLVLAFLGRRSAEPAPTAVPVPPTELPTATSSPLPAPPVSPLPPRPSGTSPVPTPENQLPYGVTIPEVAPDFSLPQSAGGKFQLADHLAEGPVVLVFFQRVGG